MPKIKLLLSVAIAGVAVAQEPATPVLRGLGVSTHFPDAAQRPQWDVDALLPRMKELGVWAVRDGLSWGAVEKEKGKYSLSPTDQHWIDAVTKAGIKVVFVFASGNKLYENQLDPDAFAAAASYLAGELKSNPNVIAFEIWNEPGNIGFKKYHGGEWSDAKDAPSLEKFAGLISKTSAAVRQANPNIQIITGGGVTPATYHLLRRFPDAFKQVDGLTEHPYTYRSPPEVVRFGGTDMLPRDGVSVADDQHRMLSLLKLLSDESEKTTGRRLPVWVTAFGYPTHVQQDRASLYNGYTETAQAAYHTRGLVQGLAGGAKVWSLYDLVDDGQNTSEAEQNFGLLRVKELEPKPVFHAVQRVATLLGSEWELFQPKSNTLTIAPMPVDKVADEWSQPVNDPHAALGLQVHWFKTPNGYVTFVWAAGRLNLEYRPPVGDVVLDLPDQNIAKAECIDLVTGQTKSLKIEKTSTGMKARDVPVGTMPVALRWITE